MIPRFVIIIIAIFILLIIILMMTSENYSGISSYETISGWYSESVGKHSWIQFNDKTKELKKCTRFLGINWCRKKHAKNPHLVLIDGTHVLKYN